MVACSALVLGSSVAAYATTTPATTFRSAVTVALGKMTWKPCGVGGTVSCAYDGELEAAISANQLAMEVTDFRGMSQSVGTQYLDALGLIVGEDSGPASVTWFGKTQPKMGTSATRTFGKWVVEETLLSANRTTLQVSVTLKS